MRQRRAVAGPVEVDETYFGGKKKNMPKAKREKIKGRGTAGKAIVAGVKDRATNQVSARTVAGTDVRTLQVSSPSTPHPAPRYSPTMRRPTEGCRSITRRCGTRSAST